MNGFSIQDILGDNMRKEIWGWIIKIALIVGAVFLIGHIQERYEQRKSIQYTQSFDMGKELGREHAAQGCADCDVISDYGLEDSVGNTEAFYRGYIAGCAEVLEVGFENAYYDGVVSDRAYEHWREYFVVKGLR